MTNIRPVPFIRALWHPVKVKIIIDALRSKVQLLRRAIVVRFDDQQLLLSTVPDMRRAESACGERFQERALSRFGHDQTLEGTSVS